MMVWINFFENELIKLIFWKKAFLFGSKKKSSKKHKVSGNSDMFRM